MIFLRARYYNPILGRFFQHDPWSGDTGIPSTLNPYLYGFNNPIQYTDPSGENALGPVIALASSAVFGALATGVYGCFSYEWAMAGQCGCEMREDAMSMSKTDWITMHALIGGFVGLVAPLAAAAAVESASIAVVIGGAAITYAVWDGINVLDVVYEEGVGWTPCTISRAAMDLAVGIFGVKTLLADFVGGLQVE